MSTLVADYQWESQLSAIVEIQSYQLQELAASIAHSQKLTVYSEMRASNFNTNVDPVYWCKRENKAELQLLVRKIL